MKTAPPEVALEHVLTALERELIEATDEEVLAAAAELGMNPAMKGSAAFVGVKSPLLRAVSLAGCLHEDGPGQEDSQLTRPARNDPRGS
jgi:hypothetical protein